MELRTPIPMQNSGHIEFHFVEPDEVDPLKLARCTWKGFNEWELGPFENWDVPDNKTDWNPYKSYNGVLSNGVMISIKELDTM